MEQDTSDLARRLLQEGKIDRRTFLRLTTTAAGALGLGALLGACGPSAAPASPTAAPPGPTSAPTTAPPTPTPYVDTGPLANAGFILDPNPAGVVPARGGTIMCAQPGDFTDFSAWESGAVRVPFFHNVYTPLFYYDKDLNIVPALAETYEVSDDKLTLKVKLREGIKFHNGREFTADDVIWNIERIMDKDTGRSAWGLTATMEGAAALNKYELDIHYKAPTANLFDLWTFAGMMAEEAFEELTTQAIGTGPFKLVEWIPGEESRFVANEDYWEPGLPFVDGFTNRAFEDMPSMVLALEAGEVDVVRNLPFAEAPRFDAMAGYDVFRPVDLFFFNCYLHTQKKPFDSKKVRQGMAWSINRQAVADDILAGWSEPAGIPYPRSSWAFDEQLNSYYGFDLDRASQLFKEGGYPDGFEFTMVSSPIFGEWDAICLMWQSDLKEIGVTMNIETVASAEYYARLFDGDFVAMISSSGRGHKDPAYPLLFQLEYKRGGNMLGWQSDEYERLLDESIATFDVEERKALYRKIMEILLDEQFEIVIARNNMLYGAHTDKLHDFRTEIDTYWMFHRAWLS